MNKGNTESNQWKKGKGKREGKKKKWEEGTRERRKEVTEGGRGENLHERKQKLHFSLCSPDHS